MNNSFDPTDWIQSPEAVKAKENVASTEERRRVDSCVDQLLAMDIDLTDGYDKWISIGMSLAALGEAGRKPFHKVSSVHPKYDISKCDKKYDSLVSKATGEVSLGTFFHACREVGVSPEKSSAPISSNGQSVEPTWKPAGHEMSLDYERRFNEPSLMIKGHAVTNVGNFYVINGSPGAGKTGFCELQVVSFLNNKHSLGLDTWGIEVRCLQRKDYLHIDTENSKDDNSLSLERIKRKLGKEGEQLIIERDGKIVIKGFTYWCLLETSRVEERWKTLELLLETGKYEYVNLDGFLDFSKGGLNSEADVIKSINRLKSDLDKFGCTGCMTLHPNKGTEIMAGHLGSFLYRYAKGSFLIRANKNDPSVKEFTVDFGMGKLSKADMSAFEPVFFSWNSELHYFTETEQPPEVSKNYNEAIIKQIFNEYKIKGKDDVASNELKERYMELTGAKESTAKNHMQQAQKM